jgi:protein-disulfide isomerase
MTMDKLLPALVLVLFPTLGCAQEAGPGVGDPERPVARFSDQVITASELSKDDALEQQLVAIRQQEYELKRQALERLIFDRLVEMAAEKAAMSPEAYVEAEVSGRVDDPSEEQINRVLSAYRSQLNPDPDAARQQVVTALRQQQEQQLQKQLQERLFAEADVEILLEPIRFEPDLTGDLPSRGAAAGAPVTLVEYSDFQCPYCGRVQSTLEALLDRYAGQIRHVFKQLPLPMHPQAGLAAEASLCAQDQGAFWKLHDWMFANSRQISRESLIAEAEALGMDTEAFASCLDDHRYAERVQREIAEARSFGITGTPGFLINGRALRGAVPLDSFVDLVDEELQRAGVEPPAPEVVQETATE